MVYVDISTKPGWKGLIKVMTYQKTIPFSLWLLSQIRWGVSPKSRIIVIAYNPKAYSDEFTNLKAIDAESPFVFFGTIGRYRVQVPRWVWKRGDRCYIFPNYYYVTRDQAVTSYCEPLGADLFVPSSQVEYDEYPQDPVTLLTITDVWIGCNDETVEGIFECSDGSSLDAGM